MDGASSFGATPPTARNCGKRIVPQPESGYRARTRCDDAETRARGGADGLRPRRTAPCSARHMTERDGRTADLPEGVPPVRSRFNDHAAVVRTGLRGTPLGGPQASRRPRSRFAHRRGRNRERAPAVPLLTTGSTTQ